MDGLRPYPAYKESRVPWLGEVPEGWDVVPALAAYRERHVKNKGMVEKQVLSLSFGRIVIKAADRLHGLVPESFETYQVVDPGNIVVRTTDLQNDQRSLRVGLAHERGIITSAYMCLETRERVLSGYGYLLLNAYDLMKILYGYGSGLRQNLAFDDIKRMPLLVPPLSEQAAIVRFLDHVDRLIRRYINAMQKLIKLMVEERQAIIDRAVTRGLDPTVHLRASGVEFLGDVPEHWDVVRAARVCDFLAGKAHEHFVDPGGEFICVTARFVSTDGRSARMCSANFCPARPGDVLMVMSDLPRGRALARTYHVTDERAYAVNQRVCVLRARSINSGFLAYAANRNPQLLAHDDGFNQTHLANAAFKTMKIPLPPSEEQEAIVAFLAIRTGAIDTAVSRGRSEIELLVEYRSRLIVDVITGKLDVRAAAARLPEEFEGTEPPADLHGEDKVEAEVLEASDDEDVV